MCLNLFIYLYIYTYTAGTTATPLLPQRQRQWLRSSSSAPIGASVIEDQLSLLSSSSSSSGPLSSSPSPAALQQGDVVAPLAPPSSSGPRKKERRRKKAAKEAKEVKEAQQETPSSSIPTSNDEHSPAQANPEKQQQQHKKRRRKKTLTRQPKTDAASPAALAEKVIAGWENEEPNFAAAERLVQNVRKQLSYRFYYRKVFLDNVPETVTAHDLLKIFSGLGGAGKVDAVVLLEAARAPEQKRMSRTDPRRIWGGGPRTGKNMQKYILLPKSNQSLLSTNPHIFLCAPLHTAIIQLGDKETYDRALTDDMKIFGICWQVCEHVRVCLCISKHSY